jgi:hypothetical protein
MTTTPAVAPLSVEQGRLAGLAVLAREATEALIAYSSGETDPLSLAGRLRTIVAAVDVTARAAGIELGDAAPTPSATDTTAAEPEPSLAPVDPNSPAGHVAAQLVEEIGEHLSESGFSVGRLNGALVAGVAPWAEVEHLRAVARAFPDAKVLASDTSSNGILMVIVESARDDVPVQISAVLFARQIEEQAAARAWLAEIGVEVR